MLSAEIMQIYLQKSLLVAKFKSISPQIKGKTFLDFSFSKIP